MMPTAITTSLTQLLARTCYLPGLLICMLTLPLPVLAEEPIYRHVDEEGNVSFSNVPADDAEPVEVQPVNVQSFPAPPAIKPIAPTTNEVNDNYRSLTITEPKPDTTIRNTPEFMIAAKLSPGLKNGHLLRFTDNGQPLSEPSRKLVYTAVDMPRGSHQIAAQVVDSKGNVLITSDPVTVHIKRASVLNRPQPAPSN